MSYPDMPHFVDLCRGCARSIYGNTAPTPEYAERAARLLLGTAAVESAFQARRQNGPMFSWHNIEGAWGLWQMEHGAAYDALAFARNHPAVERRAGEWLFCIPNADLSDFYGLLPSHLMHALAWDRFACLMARLYYLCKPPPIPAMECERAAYWKQHWNTELGSGTAMRYMWTWNCFVEPYIGD